MERLGRELPLPQLRAARPLGQPRDRARPSSNSSPGARPRRPSAGARRGGAGGGEPAARASRSATWPAPRPIGGRLLRTRRGGQDHRVGRRSPCRAARAGRRACVVTVDPARRLADALGVESLPNVADGGRRATGPGRLHALDARHQEHLRRPGRAATRAPPSRPRRSAPTASTRTCSGLLSGTQEYMAMEKLYELTESGDYDMVVVDTPPTRNALDLLDAPRAAHPLPREPPLPGAAPAPPRPTLRAMGVATQALLRTISRVAGAEIVHDAVDFFQAFSGHGGGLLAAGRGGPGRSWPTRAPPTCVVTSPRPDAIEEATFFVDQARGHRVSAAALVVNRVHPFFGARASPDPVGRPAAPWRDQVDNLRAAQRRGGADERGRLGPGRAGGPRPGRPDRPARLRRPRPGGARPRGRPSLRPSAGWLTSGRAHHRRGQRRPLRPPGDHRGDREPRHRDPGGGSGPETLAAVAEEPPDLVIVDLQMGNMGGMAVCLELRLEASYGNLPHVPVLMLLDRRPDVFLAKRSGAEGWLVKPLDPLRLRRAIRRPARRRQLLRRLLPTGARPRGRGPTGHRRAAS